MTRIHDEKVNKLAEYNLLHDVINSHKITKNVIAIALIFCMDIWITEEVEKILINFKNYSISDVAPIFW